MGALATLVAVGLPIAAIVTAEARDVEVAPGLVDWIFVGFVAVVTIATFALLVPWCLRGGPRRQSRSAIVLSTTALAVSSIFYWTMIPVAFGVAGTYLGHHHNRGARQPRSAVGLAIAAMLLGTIATLGSVAAYVATS